MSTSATDPDALVRDEVILLVEDDELILNLARRGLERHGYHVLCANSAAEALRLAQEHPTIDLLLTDVVMPDMNGRELWQKITAIKPGLKTLFMSGYGANAVTSSGPDNSEVVEFIQKPFSMAALAGKVREVFDA